MQYYTYVHCRPDGTPFYVGKGVGKRGNTLSFRNDYYKKVVQKYGKDNIGINIYPCSTELAALSLEKVLIKFLRGRHFGLTNVMGGGQSGASGLKNPAKRSDVRLKMKSSAALAVAEGRHNSVANPPLRDPIVARKVSEDHQRRLADGTHHLLTNNPAKKSDNRVKKSKMWSGENNPMRNKDIIAKRINPSHIPSVVAKRTEKLKGRVCVNNGVKYIRVYPEDVQAYLDNGWVKGRLCLKP